MESKYLIKHAIDNVWCAPDQDNQYIIELHRVSKLMGETNRVILFNRKIHLPILNKRFHVFTSDRTTANKLKLLTNVLNWEEETWFNVGDVINASSLFLNIYNEKGVELPKFQSWYMVTKENSLIFAFEENTKIPINYKSEVVYIKTYTNAFYSSMRDTSEIDTHYEYKVPINTDQILEIQNLYELYNNKPGYVFCYINGIYTNKIDLIRTSIGDTIEFIYDSSVDTITRYTIADLETFNSALDGAYKYLIMRNDNRNGLIDYLDDIDIHIVVNLSTNIDKGIYFHRNNIKAVRMVTHRDYSLLVDNVVYETNKLKELFNMASLDNGQMMIEIKVRNSGFDRPLIYEDKRLHELYKLEYSDRIQAMVGLNALDVWKAENLEESYYNKLMNIDLQSFNITAVEKAYGYNGMSIVMADTPTKTHLYSSMQRIMVPQGLANNTTFYEYDINGNLLEKHYQPIGSQYIANNSNARLIEAIYGLGTDMPDVKFGTNNIAITLNHSYRVYMCYIVAGFPNNQWQDVTGDGYYRVENNLIINNGLVGNEYFMVRSDKTFLTMELVLTAIAGTFYFDLAEKENRGNGYLNYILPVPLGELDIWLNGKSLIKDLDYIIKFPRVYVVNKEYLAQPAGSTGQSVKVRYTGFCDKDLKMDAIEDYGFIEHGFLSNNNRFNIRDDKVMRITVGGQLKTKADVLFSEEHSGVSIINSSNGRPYQVKDIIVPLTIYSDEDTYSLRDKSIIIDQMVEDYLTLKLPQSDRPAPSAIPERYKLVSPFFSHIINDMQSNQINNIELSTLVTDTDIINFFRDYEYLLDYDPITKNLSEAYVIIHPHQLDTTIHLDLLKMRILSRLVNLYGDNKIEISPFVTL